MRSCAHTGRAETWSARGPPVRSVRRGELSSSQVRRRPPEIGMRWRETAAWRAQVGGGASRAPSLFGSLSFGFGRVDSKRLAPDCKGWAAFAQGL